MPNSHEGYNKQPQVCSNRTNHSQITKKNDVVLDRSLAAIQSTKCHVLRGAICERICKKIFFIFDSTKIS